MIHVCVIPDVHYVRENLEAARHQLQTYEEELTVSTDNLTQIEQKCVHLESELHTESRYK